MNHGQAGAELIDRRRGSSEQTQAWTEPDSKSLLLLSGGYRHQRTPCWSGSHREPLVDKKSTEGQMGQGMASITEQPNLRSEEGREVAASKGKLWQALVLLESREPKSQHPKQVKEV